MTRVTNKLTWPGESPVIASTGFTLPDKIFHGFRSGDLTIIGARSPRLELDFSLHLLAKIAEDEAEPVFFWSAELPLDLICKRLICLKSGKVFDDLETSQEDVERAESRLLRLPIFIKSKKFPKFEDIREMIIKARREKQVKVFLIDCPIRMMAFESKLAKDTADAMEKFKRLAKRMGVTIIFLAQLYSNTSDMVSSHPTIQDLNRVTNEAYFDNVILMEMNGLYDTRCEWVVYVDFIVAKQRNGPVGSCRVLCDKRVGYFINIIDKE